LTQIHIYLIVKLSELFLNSDVTKGVSSMTFKALLSCVIILSASQSVAETQAGQGKLMSFGVGYGILVNEGSSLVREWVLVNDERLPVALSEFSGAEIHLADRNWRYQIDYKIDVTEPIAAIEVRFIPFDVWGEKGTTLSMTEIKDYTSGSYSMDGVWRISSENEATEHFAMVAYIAQVKLASGAVLRANTEDVVAEAQRFSQDFTSGDLDTESQ
jgi:hypothetical protein